MAAIARKCPTCNKDSVYGIMEVSRSNTSDGTITVLRTWNDDQKQYQTNIGKKRQGCGWWYKASNGDENLLLTGGDNDGKITTASLTWQL